MEWITKKVAKINNDLSIELDLKRKQIKIDTSSSSLFVRSSHIQDLILALQESLNQIESFHKPIAKPKPSDKISTSHTVDGRLVTGVSWDKNKIQLDNSDWISVDNARQYHKGDTYHG